MVMRLNICVLQGRLDLFSVNWLINMGTLVTAVLVPSEPDLGLKILSAQPFRQLLPVNGSWILS